MTVSTTTSRIDYTGDGVTTTYAYPFKVFAASDLQVYVNGVLKVLTTDYTVTGAGLVGGGNVVFVVAPTALPIAIKRVVANTQLVDYVAGDSFPAETHENALDRLTMICQQIQEQADRAPKLEPTSLQKPSLQAVTFATLPAAAVSKGMLAVVSDSSTAVWGATITGGGANVVLAFCNGTNWKVAG